MLTDNETAIPAALLSAFGEGKHYMPSLELDTCDLFAR